MFQRTRIVRTGFTLVELLIVVALMATLLSLLMPAVLAAQKKANTQETVNDLMKLGLAAHSAYDVHRVLPPAYGKLGAPVVGGPKDGEASIFYHLLPFVEQEKLYKTFKADAVVEAYTSSEDPSLNKYGGACTFAANLRLFTTKGMNTAYNKNLELKNKEDCSGKTRLTDISDGTANTLMFATKHAVCGEGGSRWASSPLDKTGPFFGQNAAMEKASANSAKATFQLASESRQCLCSPFMAQSFSKKGLTVGLADGGVRTIAPGISFETWNLAVQPNDGNPLDEGWNK